MIVDKPIGLKFQRHVSASDGQQLARVSHVARRKIAGYAQFCLKDIFWEKLYL